MYLTTGSGPSPYYGANSVLVNGCGVKFWETHPVTDLCPQPRQLGADIGVSKEREKIMKATYMVYV